VTQPPPNSATPEDIEAALQHLRTSVGAPPPQPLPEEKPRRDRPARSRGGWGRFFALLVLAAAAGAVGVLFVPALNKRGAPADPQTVQRVAQLEARLDALARQVARDEGGHTVRELTAQLVKLDERVKALEARPAAAGEAGVAPERVQALAAEIAEVRAQLAALDARVAGMATPSPVPPPVPPQADDGPAPAAPPVAPLPAVDVPGELAALDQRISAIEDSLPAPEVFTALDRRISDLEAGATAAAPNTAQRNAALALIVARLSQAVSEGRPFVMELAALQEAQPGLVDGVALQPYAVRGLPPVAVLGARLEALDRDIRAAADEDRGGDWWDRLWRGIAGLIVVRTEGEAAGNAAEDRLERALWRLRAGDLRAAANEIGALTGRAGEAASVWLGDARARLAVEDAIDQASARILQDLARTGP